MGIGEGAEKSVGAAHVCVGNHDNPASSNYQASSHWNLYFFPWKGGGGWKIKWKVLTFKRMDRTGQDETQEMQATRFKREWSIAHGEYFKARECW